MPPRKPLTNDISSPDTSDNESQGAGSSGNNPYVITNQFGSVTATPLPPLSRATQRTPLSDELSSTSGLMITQIRPFLERFPTPNPQTTVHPKSNQDRKAAKHQPQNTNRHATTRPYPAKRGPLLKILQDATTPDSDLEQTSNVSLSEQHLVSQSSHATHRPFDPSGHGLNRPYALSDHVPLQTPQMPTFPAYNPSTKPFPSPITNMPNIQVVFNPPAPGPYYYSRPIQPFLAYTPYPGIFLSPFANSYNMLQGQPGANSLHPLPAPHYMPPPILQQFNPYLAMPVPRLPNPYNILQGQLAHNSLHPLPYPHYMPPPTPQQFNPYLAMPVPRFPNPYAINPIIPAVPLPPLPSSSLNNISVTYPPLNPYLPVTRY